MSDGIPAFEDSKDYFGELEDQEAILEADRTDERKAEAIQETLESYWKNFKKPTQDNRQYIGAIYEEMIRAIKVIDETITAEQMFELICNEFLHLHCLEKRSDSFINTLFFDDAIFNLKSLVLISLYNFFPDEDLHKIKDELLTK